MSDDRAATAATASPADAGAAGLLDYASPRAAREPWGPLIFRPSLRSLVLLALTALAAVWLSWRHDPWRRVGTVPANQTFSPPFTRDGQLLILDSRTGVNLYDPTTARLVRNVLPALDINTYRYFPLAGGDRVLALPYVDRIAPVYDVASGRVVERLPNPDGLGSRLLAMAPDGPRLVTTPTSTRGGADNSPLAWDLARAGGNPEPVQLGRGARFGDSFAFSENGRRLLLQASPGFALFDGNTFARLGAWSPGNGDTVSDLGFAGTEHFWVARAQRTGQFTSTLHLDLRSAASGDLVRTIPLLTNKIKAATGRVVVSADARRAAVHTDSPSGSFGSPALEVVDLGTGTPVGSPRYTFTRPIQFFPDSNRLLAADEITNRLAVLDPRRIQPLALLPPTPSSPFIQAPQVSPDGRTIVTATTADGSSLAVYRPTGWDCPESQFGALAFPHTWLTAALFALLTLSLLRDARLARRASAARPVSRWLIAGLVLVALPLTTHALLAACLGRWVRTPAPLLLLATLGLATHARFWRLATLVLLSTTLAWCAYLLVRLSHAGLPGDPVPWMPLDRTYAIPGVLPTSALALATALVALAIVLLVVPSRRAA